MNQKVIDGFFQSSKETRAVLNQLATMPLQPETVIDDLENRLRHKMSRHDIVAVFRALHTYGAGEFIEGCLERPSRFRWS